MKPDFVHLRVHSEFSLVDGIVKIKPLVKRLLDFNMPAVALTEQSNLFSLVKFYRATQGQGLKAIVGADVHIFNEEQESTPFCLTLLASNQRGYTVLTELVSKAYQEGQHQGVPMLKKQWIEQNHEGLIALSGAMAGDVGKALLAENAELAEQCALYWSSVFDQCFYFEIQRVGKPDEERYIHSVVDLALKLELPVVATNDVRFLDQSNFDSHEVRVCINQGRVLDDTRRPKNYTNQQYLRSTEEMRALFADIPEALENTVEIAKRCNVELTLGKNYLPDFPVPEGMTLDEFFIDASRQGLEERLQQYPATGTGTDEENRKVYLERLTVELEVITQMGFPGYFMIVADFIQWAKNHAIPVGPGRGSGAGSLVAYVLKITDLDPIEFDLLFERFLNPERVSMPDFDIDFCMDRRDEVIDYVARHYGRDHVSQIITYGSMAAKAVIRDVGRVSAFSYGFVDSLAKLIPFEIGMTLTRALQESPDLKQRYETEDDVKSLIDMALSLEGISRNAGKHAGGVVISPTKLTDFSALYCEQGGGNLVTQFDKDDVEAVGLVKFDFLGLRTLTIIDWALQTINAKNKLAGDALVDISQIPRDDLQTYEIFAKCQTTAVFQLESRGMKELIRKLKPDCFDDIIALVALFRPGPLESGMVDDYINVKHGAKAEYAHDLLVPILSPTNGVILYQEQVMQIARELAGYTLGGADMLRRCLSGSTTVIDVKTGQCISLAEIAECPDYWRGRKVFSLNLTTQKIVQQTISEIYPNGVRQVWEITTKTHRKIRATAEHLFYTIQGWQALEKFKVGDYIGLAKQLPIKHHCNIADAQIKLIAYLIGDGHLSAKKVANSYFCNSDMALINDFNQCCLALFEKESPIDAQHHQRHKTVYYARVGCITAFNHWVDKYVKRAHSRDKEIPLWVHQLSSQQLCLFLGILWSTDGSFDTGIGHGDYTSTSKKLIEQIQHLLLRLGIVALFNVKRIQYQGQPHISYRAQITGREDMVKFCQLMMPFLSDAKREKAELTYQNVKNKLKNQSKHLLPKEVIFLIAESKYASGMSWKEIDSAVGYKKGLMSSGLSFKEPGRRLSRHRVKNFGLALNDENLVNIADSDIFWDEIISIEAMGEEEVFDLSIPETHNFIVNDFIAHNCMGKKKPEEMAQQREIFTTGAIKNNIDESIATYVFDLMEKFAGYGFNKTVDENTVIRTFSGNKVIKDCKQGDIVFSMNSDGSIEKSCVVALHDHGNVPLHLVEFDDGTIEKCTLDHKWFTQQGQLPLWKILDMEEKIGAYCFDKKASNDRLATIFRQPIKTTFLGWHQGYDLEVDHPEHNFLLASGLCCSNSHSAAYALVAYQTAWLKRHYPQAFMAAVMSADMDNTDKVVILIEECREMELPLCPPDINLSQYRFTVNDNNEIVYGMGAIKGVGESAILDLLDERNKNGLFIGLYDVCKRVQSRKVNRRALEALIKAGAFDRIDTNRAAHLAELTVALKVAEQHGKMRLAGQNDLFGLAVQVDKSDDEEAYSTSVEQWTEKEHLEAEKITLGLYLTGHPIDQYEAELKHIRHGSIGSLLADAERSKSKMEGRVAGLIVEMRTRQTKKGTMMGFATLDDRTGRLEVAAFSKTFEQYRDILSKDTLLVAEGSLSIDDFSGGLRLTADKMYTFEQARELFARCIQIKWMGIDDSVAFINSLKATLQPFVGGGCPVQISYCSADAKAIIQLSDNWRIHPTDELILRLTRLLSEIAVEVKYR